MTGPNKILTVSYGTFSCTLEGFDDPFGTMRGIAEYFRDLAADDRYFGAEPPTPDVEMLQNIAQKEVNRRVEARVGQTGIALTQAPAAEAPATEAPKPEAPKTAPAPKDDALDTGPLAFDDEYLLSDEPEDVLTVDDSVPPATEIDRAETVAEKLRRIRAVVSRQIEPGDAPEGFNPAPVAQGDAGAEAGKGRANTQTINEISAALSEEDEFEDDDESDASEDHADLDDDAIDDEELSDLARLDGLEHVGEADDLDNVMAMDPAPAETEEDEDDGQDDALIANVLNAGKPSEENDQEPNDASPLKLSHDNAVQSRPRSKPVATADEDVGRLLKETDNQLADDAGIRRRRVISQMRAAVAATKADKILSRVLSRKDADVEQATPYKDDLNKAITRNPEGAAKPTDDVRQDADPKSAEKSASKAPPLVLVSSQRVDEPAKAETKEGFKDFAREMGASELPDLMEAAAAYAAFVEGQPHFSRPEIMKRVAAVDPALEVSREAGLRSFGQLLRQGKIKKLERGQFVIDEETRFNPGQRIAGE